MNMRRSMDAQRKRETRNSLIAKGLMTRRRPVSTMTRINRLLRAAGHGGITLARGHDYYYLRGDGGLTRTAIYAYRLNPTQADFEFALREVNDILRENGRATI